jgi:hypothetical protein
VNNQGGIVVGFGDDLRETFHPKDILIVNNVITASTGRLVSVLAGDVTFGKNILYPSGSAVAGDGLNGELLTTDPKLVAGTDGIFRPSSTSPAIDGAPSATYGISNDMDGQLRTGMLDLGADEVTK